MLHLVGILERIQSFYLLCHRHYKTVCVFAVSNGMGLQVRVFKKCYYKNYT